MDDLIRKHNTRQIARYLEFAPSFIGPGPPPTEPMGNKHKGTSRVPATDKAHDFWFEPCNLDAAKIIEPRVAELRNTRAAWAGVYFSALLAELYQDPTTVARWERKETGEDGKRLTGFKKMCRLLADSIAAEYPKLEINTKIPRRSDRRGAGEWQAEHNRDNNDKRSERAAKLGEAIRVRYGVLRESCPSWTDAEVRGHLQKEFSPFATKGNGVLSRETVNAALRNTPDAAA